MLIFEFALFGGIAVFCIWWLIRDARKNRK